MSGSGFGGGFRDDVSASLVISPSGSGSACSFGAPCSLATALALHRPIVANDGVYRLPAAIALTSLDSGHSISAAPGAHPEFWGSVQAGSFTVASGSVMKASVAAGTSNRQLWTKAAGSNVWRRRIRAQAPASTLGTWTINSTGFAGTSTLGSLPDKLDLEIRGQAEWIDFRCPLSGVTNAQLTGAPPCWGLWHGGTAGGPTPTVLGSVENSLGLLSAPGMFYLDQQGLNGTANELYYEAAPSDGTLSAADVEVPLLSQLVTLTGVSGFSFAGITFRFSSWVPQAGDGVASLQGSYVYQTVPSTSGYLWTYTAGGASMAAQVTSAAVTLSSSSATFTSCSFENLGSPGISFQNGSSGLVDLTWFKDVSSSGVLIGSSMQTSDQTSGVANVTVQRSATALVGQDYWGSPAIQAGYVNHVTIANNDLFLGNYDGTMVGGFSQPGTFASYGLNAVDNNRFSGFMRRLLRDGAADYWTGNQPIGGSSETNGNAIDNTAEGPQAIVYWDTRTSGMVGTGNVIEDDSAGATCLLYIQIGGSPGLSNTFTGNWSNDSAGCNPGTWDPSNTFATPTPITTIYDSAVASVLAASGSPLRGVDLAFGAPVTVSGGSTAAQLTDNNYSTFGNGWTCNATPCTATIDLGSAKPVAEVDVAYAFGVNTASQSEGYSVSWSNDLTTWTQFDFVDTAGSFQSYFYSGVEPFYGAATARYWQVKSTTNVLSLAEIEIH